MPFNEKDIIYYRRRIEVTRAQAAQAECPSARHAYQELLRLYLEKIGDPEQDETALLPPAASPPSPAADQEPADDIHPA